MTTVVHFSTAHSTGDTRIFHKELQTLAKHGYNCHYVVFDDGETTVRNGVTVHPLGNRNSRIKRWNDLPQLYSVVSNIDADVYHFHDWDLIPLGVTLKIRTSAPVIYDVHEDYPHLIRDRDWIPNTVRPFVNAVFPRFEALTSQYFDGVIAATEWVEQSLRNRGVSEITTIHNFPKTADIEVRNSGQDNDQQVLVYVGNLSEIRGIMDMIELLGELHNRGQDVNLVCIGEFVPERLESDAHSLIHELGLEHAVEFPGYVEYDQMFQHLAAADIGLALLNVEHYEGGIPTKLFEYMYSRLPVVITDIQATDKYVSTDWGRVVSEDNLMAQADAVEEILNNPTTAVEMGQAGRQAVKSEFSWEAEEKKLLTLYQNVLSAA